MINKSLIDSLSAGEALDRCVAEVMGGCPHRLSKMPPKYCIKCVKYLSKIWAVKFSTDWSAFGRAFEWAEGDRNAPWLWDSSSRF